MSVDLGFQNVGTDPSLVIQNMLTGARVSLDGRRVRFTQKSKDDLETSTAVSEGGKADHTVMPHGYEGSLEAERSNDSFAALKAFLDAAFYAGAPRALFTVTTYEPNAQKTAMAVYQFQRVVFYNYDRGTWERSLIKPSVQWAASECVKLQ